MVDREIVRATGTAGPPPACTHGVRWGCVLLLGVGALLLVVAVVAVAGVPVVTTVGGLALVAAGLWRMYRQVSRP